MHKRIPVKCSTCGKDIEVSIDTYNRQRNKPTPQFRCKECYSEFCKSKGKFQWENKTPEEKQKVADFSRKHMLSIDDDGISRAKKMNIASKDKSKEELNEINQKRSVSVKQMWDNRSSEDRQQHAQAVKHWWDNRSAEDRLSSANKISEKKKEWWNDIDPETYEQFRSIMSNTAKQYWDNLDEDTKAKRMKELNNASIAWYHSLSDEDKNEFNSQRIVRWRKWWDSLTDEDLANISKQNREHAKNYYNSLSDEERRKISQDKKEWWDNLSDKEKANHARKSAVSSHNEFAKWFESKFSNSIEHHVIREFPCSNNRIVHSWDYGIFDENGELIMVVDLDGKYFHADNCDYNGKQSRMWYDERRFTTVPHGIKFFVIREKHPEDFDAMMRLLRMPTKEFYFVLLHRFRSMPFPYPHYSATDLLKRYQTLVDYKATSFEFYSRLGDSIINEFHHSIWHDHIEGKLSAYDALQNDDMLLDSILQGYIYPNYMNNNKILLPMNIHPDYPAMHYMSASIAKIIISNYLQGFDTIFDPFSGYSGRLLGTISSDKKYIGQDSDERHVRESNELLEFLKKYGIDCEAEVTNRDALTSSGEYQCMFTCPPSDEMIDVCLNNFKCQQYVFVVSSTEKYSDHVVSVIRNRSIFQPPTEKIIIIDGTK